MNEEEENGLIHFKCRNCGQKISVPEVHAGKKGKCPKCKSIVVVPQIEAVNSVEDQMNLADRNQLPPALPTPVLQLNKEPPSQTTRPSKVFADDSEAMYRIEQAIKMEEAQKPPERKLPAFIDIFLYPTSISGMIHLMIFPVGTPILLFLSLIIPGYYRRRVMVFGCLCIFIGYILYYIAGCVHGSAKGEIRASDTLMQSTIPDMWERIGQVIHVLVCVSICFGAIPIYLFVFKQLDWILVLLIIYGVIFFPMTLLSMVIFDSFYALNPILIIGSILSTFFRYCGMLVIFYGFVALAFLILRSLPRTIVSYFIFCAVAVYLAMLIAHLLGRFYYLNSKKLNWDV